MNGDSTGRTVRLAIVLSHPTQYYSPWFRWLARHASFDSRVFYLWDFGVRATRDTRFGATFSWDVDLLGGYASEFVPNTARRPGTDHFLGLQNPDLIGRLRAWAPDVLLCFGYAYPSLLALIAWARLSGIPLVFRGDSHFIDRSAPSGARGLLLRFLYRQFSAFACVGAANRAYFLRLGVPRRRLFHAPHAIDASRFDPALEAPRREAARLRESLGIGGDRRVLLFAGKFHPEKQPLALLEAYLGLARNDLALVFVGDGEQRDLLATRARGRSDVHLLPFANQSEMPSRYLLADLFVLPSIGLYETWGLAVNEAMSLGIPCIVSNRVGCQADLVTHDETGWVFEAAVPGALRSCLELALSRDPAPFRERALRRVAAYSYAAAAEGLQAAVRHAMGGGR